MGALDIFSRACRPSQTAHLPLSQGLRPWLGMQPWKGGVPLTSPQPPERLVQQLPPTLCNQSRIPATGCSKAPRGLLSPLGVPGLFVQVMWVHRVPGGDSGALVDPFMHVGTYPTRHLATLSNTHEVGAGPYLHPSGSHPHLHPEGTRRMVSEASTRRLM